MLLVSFTRNSCFDRGLWPVPCLHQCCTRASETWNTVLCFSVVRLALSLSLCCFVIRAQIEKGSQVALLSAELVQKLSFCQSIGKSDALFVSFIVILFGVVLHILVYRTVPVWQTLPRTSLCSRTLGSANLCFLCTSRSAEYFVWSIRVLCEVGDLFDAVFRALCEVRDVSSGFSAHSVRCEQVLSFPAYPGNCRMSCPTQLVACLHRVSVVCENISLFPDPLVNLERRTLVDWWWCTCYIPCTYTHLLHDHFSARNTCTFCLRTLRTLLMRVTHTHGSSSSRFSMKIQFTENYTRQSTTWRSKIHSEEIQNTHYSSHNESLNLKDDNYWKPINGQIKLNEREYICVADW